MTCGCSRSIMRGHGDSDWVKPPAYKPHDYAADLANFIREEVRGDERPIVVGHSMGGVVTLAFASRYADLARGVVVVDTAVVSTPWPRSIFAPPQGIADRCVSGSRNGEGALPPDAERGRDS